MDIKIYNTLSRSKEVFKPIQDGCVGFYQCGPTMYWTQHIGNMRAVVASDFMVRTLTYFDYKVKFVRNYTDVGHLTSDGDEGEDKMEKGAKRDNITPQEVAEKYIAIYDKDVESLNIILPDVRPRATEYIQEIIEMDQVLLDKGFAYVTPLAIYFDTSKAKDYYRLSRQTKEGNLEGAGTAEIVDPDRKNPEDFVLWFFRAGDHEKAIQYWKSPFESSLVENGNGFPGWHIECSAMAKKNLGDTFDLHMGGVEHIPVHHTNEIAQSESANGTPYVNYWIHNEHLLVNNAKMSKSDGTGYTVAELIEKGYKPLDLRYFFLQASYRSKQNFTWEALTAAQTGLDKLYKQVASLGSDEGVVNEELKKEFMEALADDFNTPKALALVSKLFKADISNADKLSTLFDLDKVLGLKISENIKKLRAESEISAPEDVQKLVNERETARKNKNWAESDRLRDEIFAKGFEVLDTEEGSKVLKK